MAKATKQKVDFTYHAPAAQSVVLAGDFTAWEQNPVTLKKSKDGTWKKSVSLTAGRYQYRFLVDGQWKNDPSCKNLETNPFGGENCVCEVKEA